MWNNFYRRTIKTHMYQCPGPIHPGGHFERKRAKTEEIFFQEDRYLSSSLDGRLSALPSLVFDESRQKVECLKSMRCLLLTSMQ